MIIIIPTAVSNLWLIAGELFQMKDQHFLTWSSVLTVYMATSLAGYLDYPFTMKEMLKKMTYSYQGTCKLDKLYHA